MQLMLIIVPVIGLALAVLLVFMWLVPYSLLVFRIQRKHPAYYTRIGQPYVWFTNTDISFRNGGLRRKRGSAWLQFLRAVYTAKLPYFPHDSKTRKLANTTRSIFTAYARYCIMVALVVLPLEGVAFVAARQASTPSSSGHGAAISAVYKQHTTGDDTAITKGTLTGGVATPPVTPTDHVSGQGVQSSYGATADERAPTPVATPHSDALNREDLAHSFASIGLPGQKRPLKQEACDQLILQAALATDLGPPGAICSDSNLATYSTY